MLAAAIGVVGFVLGLLLCASAVVVDWVAWFLVLPGRRPGALGEALAFGTDPVAPERRLGEPIWATATDGVALAGLWHPADPLMGAGEYAAPDAAGAGHGSKGAVLVLHGFAEDPGALRSRMEALNRHGWDVAAVDTRAHGRSGGDRGSFGARESADVRVWVDTLARDGRLRGGAHPTVAVWGRSMGAAVATRAAADDPRVTAVVLEAPYVDLRATMVRVLRRKRVPLPGLFARLVLRRARRLAGVSLARPRPIDLAPRVGAPVLVVHGTDDALIPPADARRLVAAFPRPAGFLEVAGAGHANVVDTGGAPLLDQIAAFLDAHATGGANLPLAPSSGRRAGGEGPRQKG